VKSRLLVDCWRCYRCQKMISTMAKICPGHSVLAQAFSRQCLVHIDTLYLPPKGVLISTHREDGSLVCTPKYLPITTYSPFTVSSSFGFGEVLLTYLLPIPCHPTTTADTTREASMVYDTSFEGVSLGLADNGDGRAHSRRREYSARSRCLLYLVCVFLHRLRV
jgi:hypothetical protein